MPEPSEQEFRSFYFGLMTETLKALRCNFYQDNFDAERFPEISAEAANAFNARQHASQVAWFHENVRQLHAARTILADETSRNIFDKIIQYRMSGHLSTKIPVEYPLDAGTLHAYRSSEKNTPSALPELSSRCRLKHYDFDFCGNRYIADCLGFEAILYRKQYYFSRNGIQIAPQSGDFIIDGGACLGESAIAFGRSAGPHGAVFAFDPVQEHIEVSLHNATQNPDLNVQIVPFGLSDQLVEGPPIQINTFNPGFSANSASVPLVSIDALSTGNNPLIERVDFIKMDIEGSELAALRGAQETIAQHRPRMAISLYHKPDDIFEIPLYIKSTFPFYQLHLAHYTIHNEETVLYCQPVQS